MAVAAALTRPWTNVVLSRAATPAQLDSSMQATRLALTEEEIEGLGFIAEQSAIYWNKRGAIEWN